jgi:hypothetical protein
MYTGIKTKIVRDRGYWKLIIADQNIAQKIAKEVPGYMDELDGNDMVLATITRSDFVVNRPNWQIQDWRIAPFNERITPWLCPNHHSETFVPDKIINNPKFKEITNNLRNFIFEGSFVSGGEKYHRIRWNNYRGVIMTEEKYLPDETFGETYVWKFKEARSMIGDIKEYWNNFDGKSIMDAKEVNSFESRSSTDVIMSFGELI